MNYIKNICLVLIVYLAVSGCNDYLDTVPFGRIIPTATSDYRLLLNQVESQGRSAGIVDSYSNDLFMQDNIQITPLVFGLYKAAEINAFSFSGHIYLDSEIDIDWSTLYNHVYINNLIIDEVMDSNGGTLDEKEMLQNEARTHRAFAYLSLVNLYARHYNSSTASSDLGVPLRKNTDFEEDLTRATVQEVYDYILEDLELAVENLPERPELGINYRPTLAGAYGLLARTYLYMNNAEEALKYADLSLSMYNVLNDYNLLQPAFANALALPRSLEDPEAILIKRSNSGTAAFKLSDELAGLYDPVNDLRLMTNTNLMNLPFDDENNGFLSGQWSQGRLPNRGISTAEMYLIRAESYARQNNVSEAIDNLNSLRQSRYITGSDFSVSATTSDEALNLVKEERRRELAFLGQRLFDIKRYNAFDGDNISVIHTLPDGSEFRLMPDDPRFVLPIARREIGLNPEIQQNPR